MAKKILSVTKAVLSKPITWGDIMWMKIAATVLGLGFMFITWNWSSIKGWFQKPLSEKNPFRWDKDFEEEKMAEEFAE